MKFSELLQLPYDRNTGIVDIEAILARLPNTPSQVAKQFLSDHGRNSNFQAQYRQIDLSRIEWRSMDETALALSKATVFSGFKNWYDNVARRPDAFGEQGWKCIDSRKPVQEQWKEHGTWLVPPVLLQAKAADSSSEYHLAEGHTRVGLLSGLISKSLLAPESKHTIWLGACDA